MWHSFWCQADGFQMISWHKRLLTFTQNCGEKNQTNKDVISYSSADRNALLIRKVTLIIKGIIRQCFLILCSTSSV